MGTSSGAVLTEIAPGVLVTTVECFVTTTTVVVGAAGACLVIDPAATVADLCRLAAALTARGLRPTVGFSTHPHWDHLLWHALLGSDVPRYATAAAVAAAERERDALVAEVESAAPGHDLALFARLTAVATDAIEWDGPTATVIAHDAHAPGHAAVFLPDSGVLVAGDLVSDLEIPLLDLNAADPLGDYRTALSRLAAIASDVRRVVPGHGRVGDGVEFRRRLAADRAYLELLARGEAFDDPRLTQDWLRAAHEAHSRIIRRA